jgi:hypothetical protein
MDIKFKDWDLVFVRNEYGLSLYNKIFYFLIRFFLGSKYNHIHLIREFNNKLYICESIASGFVVSKTLYKWLDEQKKYKREFLIKKINNKQHLEKRFNELLGCNYNARYFYYLINKKHNKKSFNCFQSIGYLLGLNKWWEVKPNFLLKILK